MSSFRWSALILLFLIIACEDWDLDRVDFLEIQTVGTLDVGPDRAVLLGDIQNLRESTIQETGFLLSDQPIEEAAFVFGSPNVEQYRSSEQDDITEEKAFGATITGLESGVTYYFRAYALLTDGEQSFGSIESFTTIGVNLTIVSVQKETETCETNAVITIEIGSTEGSQDFSQLGIVWHNDLFIVDRLFNVNCRRR